MIRTASWAAWLAVLALGVAGRRFLPANVDESWLLTVAEKWLDGARLYIDIIEPNPPMSIYLYAPAVLAGRLLGVRPELVVDVAIFAFGALCVWWCARRLPSVTADAGSAAPLLAPFAYAALVVLPAFTFGEREHIALLLFLPWLTIATRRASASEVKLGDAIIAGVAGGLVMAIKPHFALAVGAASLATAIGARNWRTLFSPENSLAGVILAAYLVVLGVGYPAYWVGLRTILELYLDGRKPVWDMLFGAFPALAIELAAIAAYLAWRHRAACREPWAAVGLSAVAGFFLAAVAQGKGWPYHFYPAFGLLLIVLAALACFRRGSGGPDTVLLVFVALFFGEVWGWNTIGLDMRVIEPALADIAAHPRIASLASDPSVGFPAARDVGGVWVDRAVSRWIPYYANGVAARDGFDPGRLPDLRAAVERDRRGLAQDIREGSADVLLVERKPFDFLDWARRDPELGGLLACFHRVSAATVGDPGPQGGGVEIEIWARPAPATAANCPP